jgi:hypothetical protein
MPSIAATIPPGQLAGINVLIAQAASMDSPEFAQAMNEAMYLWMAYCREWFDSEGDGTWAQLSKSRIAARYGSAHPILVAPPHERGGRIPKDPIRKVTGVRNETYLGVGFELDTGGNLKLSLVEGMPNHFQRDTETGVEAGTEDPVAAYHQEGGETNKGGVLPSRPVLVAPPQDVLDAMGEVIAAGLSASLERICAEAAESGTMLAGAEGAES